MRKLCRRTLTVSPNVKASPYSGSESPYYRSAVCALPHAPGQSERAASKQIGYALIVSHTYVHSLSSSLDSEEPEKPGHVM